MPFLAYLGARLKEASSYAGAVAMLLGMMHIANAPDLANAIVGALAGLGGLIAVLVPEGGATVTIAKALFLAGGLGAVALGLAACTAGAVRNDIAAAEVALTATEEAATLYAHLPRCPGAALCADPAAVAALKRYDEQAYQAIKQAKAGSGTIAAALTAIANFKAAIPAAAH